MAPENGINNERVKFFDLEEYVSKISLNDNTKYHLEDTTNDFHRFANSLAKYSDPVVNAFLINSYKEELDASNQLESHHDAPKDLYKEKVFFNKGEMNHEMIKKVHGYAYNGSGISDYRKCPAWIGNDEKVIWYPPEYEDIEPFMEKFIKIYKNDNYFEGQNDPFISSFLAALLLIRIQPFKDGNKRTSRLVQNIKFTDKINELYGTTLVLSPINLSKRIHTYSPVYYKRIHNIYFDLEHENNDEINEWFDFYLSMCDEQMYYLTNKIKRKNYSTNYLNNSGDKNYEKIKSKA